MCAGLSACRAERGANSVGQVQTSAISVKGRGRLLATARLQRGWILYASCHVRTPATPAAAIKLGREGFMTGFMRAL